ncbi:signal peptidase I [Thermococcus sp. Bubb.Bath]|uniref:signal peptidase I n=1 Tax=Thermococcus sp. Bubb.Bath TaxID=1638242 RepID=UPI00143AD97F|nr:signal peptidase I [Thermococcus sp. Bubb.Bath]NJF26162.1 signal peptidase I [Thermococcus sp. Bubb.Bath]
MKKLLEGTITAIVLIILMASVVGFVLDRPVFVSYAYSKSMTPTINKGDLFFMNPLSKGGEVGDIIVFHRRDGWTVHRIFAVVDGGYVTKGDNNVATDQQDGAYPLVRKENVVGKVVTVMRHPLVIRGGGAFIESVRSKLTNVYAIGIMLLLGVLITFSSGGKERKHRGHRRRFLRVRAKTVYAAISVLIVVGFLFVTVASWGTLAFSYSSTLAGGQREGWYLPGTTFEKNLSVENRAVYPFHYFLEPKGGRLTLLGEREFTVNGGGTHVIDMRISVPEDTRVYREEIQVRAYPALLPVRIIRPLYDLNPYLPLVAYALELTAVLIAFYYLAEIGKGDVLRIRLGRRSILTKLMGDG